MVTANYGPEYGTANLDGSKLFYLACARGINFRITSDLQGESMTLVCRENTEVSVSFRWWHEKEIGSYWFKNLHIEDYYLNNKTPFEIITYIMYESKEH